MEFWTSFDVGGFAGESLRGWAPAAAGAEDDPCEDAPCEDAPCEDDPWGVMNAGAESAVPANRKQRMVEGRIVRGGRSRLQADFLPG